MKSKLQIITTILLILFILSNCTTKSSKNNHQRSTSEPGVVVHTENSEQLFPLPTVPLMITDKKEVAIYLSKYYWDLFPFNDTTLIAQPEITEQGFVDYIQLLNQIPLSEAQNSLQTMMNKAKANVAMYNHFSSLSEKYFYDPNSPFRNDEFYIPVIAHLLESGLLLETKQSVYSFQQEMILKNRVGTKAADFVYTLENGDKQKMHELVSNYLILFFTNPDCPMCATTTKQIDNSEVLKSVFSLNSANKKLLTVLTIYPDSNIEEWRKALPNMPQNNWINAYDDGTIVTNKRLYDIKAIPTLYLLDSNKQVVLKDTSLEEIEEYFMTVK